MTLAPAPRVRQVPVPPALVPEPIPSAVCRRSGCGKPAGAHDLCQAHRAQQAALRAGAAVDLAGRQGQRTKAANDVADLLAGIIRARAEPWRQAAACRGLGDVMFPRTRQGNGAEIYRTALALCATCPVVEPCRAAGAREHTGVWGGTMPAQRRPRRRSR